MREIVVNASVATLAYLVLVPLVFLIWSSFRGTGDGALPFSQGVQYTLDNYREVLASPRTLQLLFNTFAFTFGSLVIGMILATALAFLVERTDIPGRGVVYVLALAPIAMPGVLVGIAWILLLGPTNGFINYLIRSILRLEGPGPIDIYSIWGMVFSEGLVIVPTTFLLLGPAFRRMDPTLEEAAAVAGASRLRIFREILVPVLLPAVGNAIIFQFVTVIQAFDVPTLIGIRAGVPVLSTRVYLATSPPAGLPDYGIVSTYAMLLLIVSLVPLLWYGRVTRQAAAYATVTGRGYRPRRIELGPWKPVALLFVAVYALATVVLPLLIMIWMSLQPFYSQPSAESLRRVSLAAFEEIAASQEFRGTVVNTLILGVAAASVSTALSAVIGWSIVRSRGKVATLLDLLSFAPHIIPGVVIAASTLLLYLILAGSLPFPVYGTVWILVIGVTTVTLGFGIRSFRASLLQVANELEESAHVAGASWLTVMRKVVLPILRPAVLNIWMWTFLHAITGLTIVLVLYSGRNGVISTSIYFRWATGQAASAAAMGVVVMGISVVLTGWLYRFVGRDAR